MNKKQKIVAIRQTKAKQKKLIEIDVVARDKNEIQHQRNLKKIATTRQTRLQKKKNVRF